MTTTTTGFATGEMVTVEWHKVPSGQPGGQRFQMPNWEEVCVLRMMTVDGRRTIRRDRIDGVSRVPTSAVHKSPEGVEFPVMTTVLLVKGQTITLGSPRVGTSEAFHAQIEKLWLGDGFDPDARVENEP